MKRNLWLIIFMGVFLGVTGCSSVTPIQTSTLEVIKDIPTPTVEIPAVKVTTPIPTKLSTNPFAGKIWDQYCEIVREDGVIVGMNCEEEWAKRPLPGGCGWSALDVQGYSGCTAAALAYVINSMLTTEEIRKIVGEPGVTPSFLIEEVYPKIGINLSCNGTSVSTIRDTLTFFGLASRTSPVSKTSLEKKILPGEMAIVGVSLQVEGSQAEHWTVVSEFVNGRIIFADSFIGRGSKVDFEKIPEIAPWDIISVLFVSKTPP